MLPFSKLDAPSRQLNTGKLNAGNCRLKRLLSQRYKFLKKSCFLKLRRSRLKTIATLFETCIMVSANQPKIYTGGCHCGAVLFKVAVEKYQVDECNCSICQKKGFLHLIVPCNKFTLLKGEEVLTTYTFNTGVAKHKFCKICGVHSFYIPRSHPDCIDVNLRCLDGNPISDFEVTPFDGANWEQNIQNLRSRKTL